MAFGIVGSKRRTQRMVRPASAASLDDSRAPSAASKAMASGAGAAASFASLGLAPSPAFASVSSASSRVVAASVCRAPSPNEPDAGAGLLEQAATRNEQPRPRDAKVVRTLNESSQFTALLTRRRP